MSSGALPETFITAAGSLETLGLVGAARRCWCAVPPRRSGWRASSSRAPRACACFATTRSEAKIPALRARGADAIVDGGRRLRRARPRRSCREAPRRRRRPDRRARGARLARSRAARRHRVQLGPARRRVGDRRLRAHRRTCPSGHRLVAYHSDEASDARHRPGRCCGRSSSRSSAASSIPGSTRSMRSTRSPRPTGAWPRARPPASSSCSTGR